MQKSARNIERYNYKAMVYESLSRDKMINKFKKMITVTKITVIIKVPINIYNNYLIIYKQAIILKDKLKWLTVMQDKLNL